MTRWPTIRHLRDDPYLAPFRAALRRRAARIAALERRLAGSGTLADFASAHEFYGLHRDGNLGWVFRELAPNATALWLVGDFSDWKRLDDFRATRVEERGVWELRVAESALRHGQHYHMELDWDGGSGTRLPAYARRVVQDPATGIFSAQVWNPPEPYAWRCPDTAAATRRRTERFPFIYEAHVGMAQEEPRVGTFREFRERILPRIAEAGYNTVQLMALMEHPYYASFGYQVANFFAPSSRFGTPEELKELVDEAHAMGLAVVMDLVHSHAVANEVEGLSRLDGSDHLYFHGGDTPGTRGHHKAWNSRCFDYGKIDTLHFLLSNCRYWLDEFRLDGFRFDGVTSMLYLHHGLGVDFTGYAQYFDDQVDEDALAYLALANRVVHAVRPGALTIAEDVSGMPGVGASQREGGMGFDLRLAMGITEHWTRLLRDVRDDDWSMGGLWYALTDHRADEQTVSYAECHDQAMVGGKTLLFEMADAAVYDAMDTASRSPVVDRAVALHKLIRLATLASAGEGYLAFMGNEFGHPEWIDFPREGNGNSFAHARRQWSLRDDPALRYKALGDFDAAMLRVFGSRKSEVPSPKSSSTPQIANLRTCEPANLGTWKPRNPETRKPANLRTCEPANLGTWKPRNPETRKPANLRTCKLANLGTCEPANLGTWKPRNLGTQEPANLQTCKLANLGNCEPANLGTWKPRNPGTQEPANLQTSSLWHTSPRLLAADEAAKVLAFFRGDLLVVLNFHPTESHADWPLPVPPGDYDLVLDTDAPEFGGQGRVAPGQRYFTAPETMPPRERGGLPEHVPAIRLYIPARCALVLRRNRNS